MVTFPLTLHRTKNEIFLFIPTLALKNRVVSPLFLILLIILLVSPTLSLAKTTREDCENGYGTMITNRGGKVLTKR
jgi:hypothetical protein